MDNFKAFLDSIDPFDEYGFQVRHHFHWLPESVEDEIKRLAMNLAKYEQYLEHSSSFPEHIKLARLKDFNRLRALGKKAS